MNAVRNVLNTVLIKMLGRMQKETCLEMLKELLAGVDAVRCMFRSAERTAEGGFSKKFV